MNRSYSISQTMGLLANSLWQPMCRCKSLEECLRISAVEIVYGESYAALRGNALRKSARDGDY